MQTIGEDGAEGIKKYKGNMERRPHILGWIGKCFVCCALLFFYVLVEAKLNDEVVREEASSTLRICRVENESLFGCFLEICHALSYVRIELNAFKISRGCLYTYNYPWIQI